MKEMNIYKKIYLEYFGVVKENPDSIVYKNITYNYTNGISTMVAYFDIKDSINHYLSYQYNNFMPNKIYSSDNEMILHDFENLNKNAKYNLKQLTHYSLLNLLFYCNRIIDKRIDREDLLLSSRLYEINGVFIITFWQEQNKIKKYKQILEKYLNDIEINPEEILYQSMTQYIDQFLDYNSFFKLPVRKMTDIEIEKAKIAQELHVNKALLDKAILNVISSKPKNINDLYSGLESQLGMPIAKIRHVFSGIPLNLLFKKTLAEFKNPFLQ